MPLAKNKALIADLFEEVNAGNFGPLDEHDVVEHTGSQDWNAVLSQIDAWPTTVEENQQEMTQ